MRQVSKSKRRCYAQHPLSEQYFREEETSFPRRNCPMPSDTLYLQYKEYIHKSYNKIVTFTLYQSKDHLIKKQPQYPDPKPLKRIKTTRNLE